MKAYEAAFVGVCALPDAAAVLMAAVQPASQADPVLSWVAAFRSLLAGTGTDAAVEMLGGCEAALRCAGQLQGLAGLASREASELLRRATRVFGGGIACCSGWMHHVAAGDAERILTRLVLLASTACKCAVLRARSAAAVSAAPSTQQEAGNEDDLTLKLMLLCCCIAYASSGLK
ncbi:hypothetical protein ABPG75_008238 [Micractinium tetrahymenae]